MSCTNLTDVCLEMFCPGTAKPQLLPSQSSPALSIITAAILQRFAAEVDADKQVLLLRHAVESVSATDDDLLQQLADCVQEAVQSRTTHPSVQR